MTGRRDAGGSYRNASSNSIIADPGFAGVQALNSVGRDGMPQLPCDLLISRGDLDFPTVLATHPGAFADFHFNHRAAAH